MVTVRTAKEKVTRLLADLQRAGYRPTRAILFGSVAKGRAHRYSDIDLAVWDDRFTGCAPIDYEPILPLLRNYPGVELHTYHASETRADNPFIEEIEKDGIELDIVGW
jgi:predicted nucleotidyltransferase